MIAIAIPTIATAAFNNTVAFAPPNIASIPTTITTNNKTPNKANAANIIFLAASLSSLISVYSTGTIAIE